MERTEITKLIDDVCKLNKEYTSRTNEALNKIRGAVTSGGSDDEYRRGCEDAWALACRIVRTCQNGGIPSSVLKDIFGDGDFDLIFAKSYDEALKCVKEYEEKNNKLEPGDVVICKRSKSVLEDHKEYKAIYLREDDRTYYLVVSGIFQDLIVTLEYLKQYYTLTKTGEHVDIQPLMDVFKE